MVRSLTFAFATVCAVAAVAAQAPASYPPAPPSQQPSSPQAAQSGDASAMSKVTLTGCLKPGTTAGTWTLETAAMPSVPGAASTPRGASGAAGAKQTFNLSTNPSDDLKPHANHKIEVIGVMSPAAASGLSIGASATSAPSDPASRLTFKVDSFKMVSASCQ